MIVFTLSTDLNLHPHLIVKKNVHQLELGQRTSQVWESCASTPQGPGWQNDLQILNDWSICLHRMVQSANRVRRFLTVWRKRDPPKLAACPPMNTFIAFELPPVSLGFMSISLLVFCTKKIDEFAFSEFKYPYFACRSVQFVYCAYFS